MMQYKGYTGKVEFDDEAEIFHGEMIGLRDVITLKSGSSLNSWVLQTLEHSTEHVS